MNFSAKGISFHIRLYWCGVDPRVWVQLQRKHLPILKLRLGSQVLEKRVMGMSNKLMRLTKQDGCYKESVWYAIVAMLNLIRYTT